MKKPFSESRGRQVKKERPFMRLKNNTLKKVFLYKKKLGNSFYFKDDTKFLFSVFEKINIFSKLKQNFESVAGCSLPTHGS